MLCKSSSEVNPLASKDFFVPHASTNSHQSIQKDLLMSDPDLDTSSRRYPRCSTHLLRRAKYTLKAEPSTFICSKCAL